MPIQIEPFGARQQNHKIEFQITFFDWSTLKEQHWVIFRKRRGGASVVQKPFFVVSGYKPLQLVIARTNAPGATTLATDSEPPFDPALRPIPISVTNVNFSLECQKYANDELALSRLGEAAFQRANYEWAIICLEKAKAIPESGFYWSVRYPYLAASYLLGENDESKFKATLDEMTNAMQEYRRRLYLPPWPLVENLAKIRSLLPTEDSAIVDKSIDLLTMIRGTSNCSRRARPCITGLRILGRSGSGLTGISEKGNLHNSGSRSA